MDKKIFSIVDKYKYIVFTVIIFLVGLYVRYINIPFESPDFSKQFSVWFYKMGKYGDGFYSLKERIGDYNVIFQFLVCLMTYLPFEPIFSYKTMSIIFDILLTIQVGKLMYCLTKDKYKAYLIACLIYMSPIVIMNSGVWGQCDSMFTFFLVLTIRMMIEKKYVKAFIYYGLAFSLKLQAIFMLPYMVMIYLVKREFGIINFLYAFLTFYATALPSILVGGSLLGPIETYIRQIGLYENMGINIINFWTLCFGNYEVLNFVAFFMTMTLLGGALLYLLEGRMKINEVSNVEIAVWCIWTCVLFLPSMHERYTYPAGILLLLLTLKDRRIAPAMLAQYICSLQTYNYYLFGNPIQVPYIMAILLMASWLYYTYSIFVDNKEVK